MSAVNTSTLDPDASEWLRRGQNHEALGTPESLHEAVLCYDRAITLLNRDDMTLCECAVAWMNRGNALQRNPAPESLRESVQSYDQAITLFSRVSTEPLGELANSLGAAWLNRGSALQLFDHAADQRAAAQSLEKAIAILSSPSLATSLAAQLNLAGAQTNLATVFSRLDSTDHFVRAYAASEAAQRLTAPHEPLRLGFADVGLKARRIRCEIIGRWIIETTDPIRHEKLIVDASDAVDSGLALVRRWEAIEVSAFRPLGVRLFRFGTEFYRRHQPHFLADFVLENLDPEHTSDAFVSNSEFHAIACEILASTRDELRTQYRVVAHDDASERRLQTLNSIESALTRLNRFPPSHSPVSFPS